MNKHKNKYNVDSIENLTEKENEFTLEVAGRNQLRRH
jgi:hypothetical protein